MYLEYQLTKQEHKDFVYYTGWASPEKKQDRLKYYAIYITLYLLAFTGIFALSVKSIHTSSIESILIVLTVGVIFFIFLRLRIKYRFDLFSEKKLKDSGIERILPTVKLNFTEAGISAKTDIAEGNCKWAAIFKKTEANNCYYLYTDSTDAIIIPKRVFSSANEKDEFDKLLQTCISEKRE